jgi:predicted NBD/HSP70 family sugar kinase
MGLGIQSVQRTPVDSAVMRAQNSGLLLRMIWDEQQISRVEISRRTGLSPSTVSIIVTALSASGLVREVGTGASQRGRRPTLLSFCDDVFFIVGVEIGIRHVSVVLTNLRGRVQAFRTERHEMRQGAETTLALVRELVEKCLADKRVSKRRLLGVGVALPSPVNPEHPGLLSELLYPAWAGVDVRERLSKGYRVPVMVDNDANLGAVAERWWGIGAGIDDLAYVKIGAGIGCGHILRGQLYRGATGIAGEMGHVIVKPDGPECICGRRGCLATLVGSDALVARAKSRLADKRATVADIVRRAQSGDAKALGLVEEVGEYLGHVLVGSVLHLMNPAAIILGGEITALGDLLLKALGADAEQRLSTKLASARIAISKLGPQSIAIGAATLLLEEALRDPSLLPVAAFAK